MQYDIRQLNDLSHLEEIAMLRLAAWETEIPGALNRQPWLDEIDTAAMHWVAVVGERIIAAARLSLHQSLDDVPDPEVYVGVFIPPPLPPIASMNRLAVAPEFRHQGIARQLDLARVGAAKALGCRVVIGSSSSIPRISQLKNCGFSAVETTNRNSRPIFRTRGVQTVLYQKL